MMQQLARNPNQKALLGAMGVEDDPLAPPKNTGITGGMKLPTDIAGLQPPAAPEAAPMDAGPMADAPGFVAPQSAPSPPPQLGGKIYAPVNGFKTEKLNGTEKYDSPEKYSDAVRSFSTGLGSGVQVSRNSIGGMVDYAKQSGFPNAKAVGDDKIDYGDGNGPIDVVMANGDLWFQNGPDRLGGGAGGDAQQGGSLGGYGGQSNMDPMLSGDPMAAIQAALAGYGGESKNLKALMAQLQQGSR